MVNTDAALSRTERLRRLTAGQHAALERVSGLPGSLRSRADLLHVLVTFHGFIAPLEPMLRDAQDWHAIGLPQVAGGRCARLRADLHGLGLSAADIAALPLHPSPPACETPAAAWGIAYVLEGSTMGGRLMSRHLAAHPDPTMPAHSHHFDAYGARTGACWRAFRSGLDALVLEEGREASLETAARDSFTRLADWFEQRFAPRQGPASRASPVTE